VLVLVATGLGLPLPGGHLAVDALLAVIGFQLSLGVVRLSTTRRNWLGRFWLTALGPIVAPTLVAVAVITATWWWLDRLDPTAIRAVVGSVAMLSNVFQIFAGTHFAAIDHLWLVAIIVQFALLLPVAVRAERRYGAPTLSLVVVAVAGAIALLRFGYVVTEQAAVPSIAINTLTRVDGLLLGAAVALTPRSLLSRIPAARAATPALGILLLLFTVGPEPLSRPLVTLGLLAPIAAVATAVILAAEMLGRQSATLALALDSLALRWLGERALSIYVWHVLFGMTLASAEPGSTFGPGWPGAPVFVIQLVFALAAGATSYRYLQIPVRTVAERLTARTDRTPSVEGAARPALSTT
jgi:peptidoglycan/LPS O-acetylase OafA/YrhL